MVRVLGRRIERDLSSIPIPFKQALKPFRPFRRALICATPYKGISTHRIMSRVCSQIPLDNNRKTEVQSTPILIAHFPASSAWRMCVLDVG